MWQEVGVSRDVENVGQPDQNLANESKQINKFITEKCGALWPPLTALCFFPGKPVMIVTEYMENGSLDTFLKVRRGWTLAVYGHMDFAHGMRLKLNNLNGKVLNGFKIS